MDVIATDSLYVCTFGLLGCSLFVIEKVLIIAPLAAWEGRGGGGGGGENGEEMRGGNREEGGEERIERSKEDKERKEEEETDRSIPSCSPPDASWYSSSSRIVAMPDLSPAAISAKTDFPTANNGQFSPTRIETRIVFSVNRAEYSNVLHAVSSVIQAAYQNDNKCSTNRHEQKHEQKQTT